MSTVHPPAQETPAPPAHHPTGIDLTELLSDTVALIAPQLDPVPHEIVSLLEVAHEFWVTHPKVWREVTLASEEDMVAVARHARRYCKSVGYTFRMRSSGDPAKLVYRVTDKVTRTPAASGQESSGVS